MLVFVITDVIAALLIHSIINKMQNKEKTNKKNCKERVRTP